MFNKTGTVIIRRKKNGWKKKSVVSFYVDNRSDFLFYNPEVLHVQVVINVGLLDRGSVA